MVEEYKDSDTFETDTVVAAIEAYNLRFDDCKKVIDAFPILDLHRITPTGKLEEDEEKDEEDEGEEPA